MFRLIETCQLIFMLFGTERVNGDAGVPASCFLAASSDTPLNVSFWSPTHQTPRPKASEAATPRAHCYTWAAKEAAKKA